MAAAAVAAPEGRRVVGVIGTAGTIHSNAYGRAIHALDASIRVEQQACPLFVPLVEEGWFDHPAAALIADEYLRPLRDAGIQVLVLGCTHYPLLKPLLRRTLGPAVALIDSAEQTALALEGVLGERGLAGPPGSGATHRFVVSDDEPRFRQVARDSWRNG